MTDGNDVDLRRVDKEDLFGEIRRRRLPEYEVVDALNIDQRLKPSMDPQVILRTRALYIRG